VKHLPCLFSDNQ